MNQYVYTVNDNLYINLTNRCSSRCSFCIRQYNDSVHESGSLWLEREPSLEEIKEEFIHYDVSRYGELVFCGFGEPTERLNDLLEIAKYLKETYHKPIRINTNGLSDLTNGKDTTALFEGVIDSISISLNAPNKERFYELTRNKFGIEAFDAMLKFVENTKKHIPHVVLTTISTVITKEEELACLQLCKKLGVEYKIRKFES